MDFTKTIRELMDTAGLSLPAALLSLAERMDRLAEKLVQEEVASDLDHDTAMPVYRKEADIWAFANEAMLRLQAQCQLMRNNALHRLDMSVQEEDAEGKDEKDEG